MIPQNLFRRPGRNASERRRKARLRAINRKLIREAKQSGCWICGRNDLAPEDLHYHHKDGAKKRRCVARMVSSATATVIDEIALCRLWCRWSHAHFHATGEVKPCAHAFTPNGGCRGA